MDKLHLVRLALGELGETSAERLTTHIEKRHGVRIEPRFIPIFKACLLDQDRHASFRQVTRTNSTLTPPLMPVTRVSEIASAPASAARQLALQLMDEHGLEGWQFAFNRRKQTMGLCVYDRQTIELSQHFVERNSIAEIRDTILHEIAHALVGPRHGHDRVWKAKCVEIGARPQRCGQAAMPEGRWQASCTSCGKRFDRHKRPKRLRGWFCRTCGAERGRLVWKERQAG